MANRSSNAAAAAAVAVAESVPEKPVPWEYSILSLTFNQDCTSLVMGTMNTYNIFTISQENRPEETYDCEIQPLTNIQYLPYQEVSIIERLFSSSLIALVTRQAPKKLKVCHFRRGSEICAYSFVNDILNVKLNRLRLIVCLEESIFIHNMRDMKLLHTIREIPSNRDGLCALSSNDSHPYLAYPTSTLSGEIQIFDTVNLKPTVVISSHESTLAALTFDWSGTRIATASSRGTVIRVHSAIDGSRLFEFRRGVRRAATIYSLAFSPDSTFLAASCSTGTIHVFRLVDPNQRPAEETTTWTGSFNTLLSNVAYYLPRQTTEVLTQDRAFAIVHLPQPTTKTIVAMNVFNKVLKLFVASYDGIVRIYEVNSNEGGECKQVGEYHLFNLSQNSNQTATTGTETRKSADEISSGYSPNVPRSNEKTVPLTVNLINGKAQSDQSFKTVSDEPDSFPQLPLPPS